MIVLPSFKSPAFNTLDSETAELLFHSVFHLNVFPPVGISVCNVRVWMDDPSAHLFSLNTRLSSYIHTQLTVSPSVSWSTKGKQTRLCQVVCCCVAGGGGSTSFLCLDSEENNVCHSAVMLALCAGICHV